MDLTNDTEAFLAAINAAPFDDAPRLIYADWLEENEHPELAEYVRLVVQLRANVDDAAAGQRLLEIAPTLAEDWRKHVGGCFELRFGVFGPDELKGQVNQAMRFMLQMLPIQRHPDTADGLSFTVVVGITYEEAHEGLSKYGIFGSTHFRIMVQAMKPPTPSA